MANSSAIFSRLHTWGITDTVLALDLNAEFNNLLTNLNPSGIGGYSSTVTQMQTQTSPGGVGTESLSTALAGELERLRFQMAAGFGTTYWYQTPVTTLAQLNTALGSNTLANKISSGVTAASGQPAFLIPDGTVNRVTLSTATPLLYSVAGVSYTISSNLTLAGLATAAASAAATVCTINDTALAAGASYTQLLGENGSTITIATAGTSITSRLGKICAFKNVSPGGASGELFIARVASATALMDVYRGYFQTGASSFATRSGLTNGDTLELMELSYIFATTAGALVQVTNPNILTYSGAAPVGPASGDYWLDLVNNIWKTYNGATWAASGSTLIGLTVQDTAKTVGTRSFDFYATYSATNTVELYNSPVDLNSPLRSRYSGSTISVYGTSLNFSKGYLTWSCVGTGLIDSTVLTTGNNYYFYVSSAGNTYCSSIAPYNRQQDLLGYYHPSAPYRCVGFSLCTTAASQTFGDVDSFYRADYQSSVATVTAANNSIFTPFQVKTTESVYLLNSGGGTFTQVIPPPSQWKGKTITYVKSDNTNTPSIVQAWGLSVLITTCTTTLGNTQISALGSTAGLTAGTPYFINGYGINPGTTVTWASGNTATLSQPGNSNQAGSSVTFATANNITFTTFPNAGINGSFQTALYTPNESVTLLSDGVSAYVVNRYIPSFWSVPVANTIGATTTPPTKGNTTADRIIWRRVGNCAEVEIEYNQNSTGAAGSGNYLWTLPSPLSIDGNLITLYTTVIAQGAVGFVPNTIGYGMASYSGNMYGLTAMPYDGTRFRLMGIGPLITIQDSASNINFSVATLSICLRLSIPMINWSNVT